MKPRYTIWQAIAAALEAAAKALEEVRALARLPGPQGEPGPQGKPGLGFADFTYDGERRMTWAREGMDPVVMVLPMVIDRGVWREGQRYERGDGASWNGSFWIAQKDDPAKPGVSNSGWRLAVKSGRDGKDAR